MKPNHLKRAGDLIVTLMTVVTLFLTSGALNEEKNNHPTRFFNLILVFGLFLCSVAEIWEKTQTRSTQSQDCRNVVYPIVIAGSQVAYFVSAFYQFQQPISDPERYLSIAAGALPWALKEIQLGRRRVSLLQEARLIQQKTATPILQFLTGLKTELTTLPLESEADLKADARLEATDRREVLGDIVTAFEKIFPLLKLIADTQTPAREIGINALKWTSDALVMALTLFTFGQPPAWAQDSARPLNLLTALFLFVSATLEIRETLQLRELISARKPPAWLVFGFQTMFVCGYLTYAVLRGRYTISIPEAIVSVAAVFVPWSIKEILWGCCNRLDLEFSSARIYGKSNSQLSFVLDTWKKEQNELLERKEKLTPTAINESEKLTRQIAYYDGKIKALTKMVDEPKLVVAEEKPQENHRRNLRGCSRAKTPPAADHSTYMPPALRR